MTTRFIHDADLQAVFRFFGSMTLVHYRHHQVIPPACVLVWLESDTSAIAGLHQFPAPEISSLLQDESGRQALAYSIQAMLDPAREQSAAPAGRRPHLVVQVLHARTSVMDAAGGPEQEVMLMLAHVAGTTHATAVPLLHPELPAQFDITATDVE